MRRRSSYIHLPKRRLRAAEPQRLSEMEGAALEANVVKWVLSKAKVTDKDIAFDELMGAQA